MKWLNFGGGHHITRPGYALATLENCILSVRQKYGVQVYLEPGEAWALNAGYLVTTVLDTLRNGDTSLAILDMSAACHTPDVIEMPYRPPLLGAVGLHTHGAQSVNSRARSSFAGMRPAITSRISPCS